MKKRRIIILDVDDVIKPPENAYRNEFLMFIKNQESYKYGPWPLSDDVIRAMDEHFKK